MRKFNVFYSFGLLVFCGLLWPPLAAHAGPTYSGGKIAPDSKLRSAPILPGQGAAGVRLGMTRAQVKKLLGPPRSFWLIQPGNQRAKRFKQLMGSFLGAATIQGVVRMVSRDFWYYPRLGVKLRFNNKGRLFQLYLYPRATQFRRARAGCVADSIVLGTGSYGQDYYQAYQGRTPLGLGVNSSWEEVVRKMRKDIFLLKNSAPGHVTLFQGQHRGITFRFAGGALVHIVVWSPDPKLWSVSNVPWLGKVGMFLAYTKWQLRLSSTSTGVLCIIGDGGKDTNTVQDLAMSPDGRYLAFPTNIWGVPAGVKLWERRRQKVVRLFLGSSSKQKIEKLLFGPKGKQLFAATAQGDILVWSVTTGKRGPLRKAVSKKPGKAGALAIDPSGRWLAAAFKDRTLVLWDLARKRHTLLRGHKGVIQALAFHPHQKTLYSASDDATVRVWDLASQRLLKTWGPGLGKKASWGRCRWTHCPSGEGCLGGRCYPFRPERGHADAITALALHPKGHLLATGSKDRTIKIWHTKTGKVLHTLRGHTKAVHALHFHPQKDLLVSGGGGMQVRYWSPQRGILLKTFKQDADTPWLLSLTQNNNITRVAFSPQGDSLVVAERSGKIHLLKKPQPRLPTLPQKKLRAHLPLQHVHTFTGHPEQINAVAFSPNGRLFASGGKDGLRIWSLTGQFLGIPSTFSTDGMAFHPDNKGITFCSSYFSVSIKRYRFRTGKLQSVKTKKRYSCPSLSFDKKGKLQLKEGRFSPREAVSPNGRWLLQGDSTGKLKLIHKKSKKLVRLLAPLKKLPQPLSFVPEGTPSSAVKARTVALQSRHFRSRTTLLKTHRSSRYRITLRAEKLLLYQGDKHLRTYAAPGAIARAAFSGYNPSLFAFTVGKIIFLLDLSQGVLKKTKKPIALSVTKKGKGNIPGLHVLQGHTKEVNTLLFARGALLSGSKDTTIIRWGLKTGRLLKRLKGHGDAIVAMALHPASPLLASAEGHQVKFWDLRNGQELETLPRAYASDIQELAFSKKGAFFFVRAEKQAALWSAKKASHAPAPATAPAPRPKP